MMFRRKKNNTRNPRINSNRQQAYHYSSRRSISGRAFNRREVSLDEAQTDKNQTASFIKNLPTIVSILMIVFGIFYLLTLDTRPSLIVINENSKTQLINKDLLLQKAETEMKKSILNRFKPTFNENQLITELIKLSPEISSLDISINALRHNVQIRASFSEPALVLSTGSNLYVVGSDGKVLADITKNKEGFNISSLPLVQDSSDIEVKLAEKILTSEHIEYINQIKFQSESKSISVASMIIKPGGSELDVKYGGLKYYVKYNFFEDARQSSGVFFAVKERLDQEAVQPLEYIDVRVPERAYVK